MDYLSLFFYWLFFFSSLPSALIFFTLPELVQGSEPKMLRDNGGVVFRVLWNSRVELYHIRFFERSQWPPFWF